MRSFGTCMSRLTIILALWTVATVADAAPDGNAAARDVTVQLVLPPDSERAKGLVAAIKGAATAPLTQNIALLLLTALVTGVAVPRVKARMDMRFFREQKEQEARLARQANLIAEQTDFLKKYVEAVWRLYFTMLQISYAKVWQFEDEVFDPLWQKYDAKSWNGLQECRRLISSAIHLVHKDTHQRLLQFYQELVSEDTKLTSAVENGRSHSDWGSEHDRLYRDFADRIDTQIALLARDLKLAV